jgi:hypothetical protein
MPAAGTPTRIVEIPGSMLSHRTGMTVVQASQTEPNIQE